MNEQNQEACHAAFRADSHSGAAIARQRIAAARQTVDAESTREETPERDAVIKTALDNAADWHNALCEHGQATADDYQAMDDLRIQAARISRTTPATKSKSDNDAMDFLFPAAIGAMGGFIMGDFLGGE